MNHDSNAPMGAEDHPLAPYNDDQIKCKLCLGTGIKIGCDDECEWCEGEGELSEQLHRVKLGEERELEKEIEANS